MKASHKEIDIIVGFQTVHLMPGQFVFGRAKTSKEIGLSERNIRTCLNYLKKSQNLTIKTTNKFSVITIINWGIYQGDDIDERPANRPTSDQQVTTNKNVKKEKKESIKKEKDAPHKKPTHSKNKSIPDDFVISDRVRLWAEQKGYSHLGEHLESFILKCRAKNYQYTNWDSAFMNAIRDDWAKVNQENVPKPKDGGW